MNKGCHGYMFDIVILCACINAPFLYSHARLMIKDTRYVFVPKCSEVVCFVFAGTWLLQ